MSQTKQQEQGTGNVDARVRKDWELFWRIIAGLMLLVVAWVIWVLYQITPRSIVTPLAYASQIRPITIRTASVAVTPVAPSVEPAPAPGAPQAAVQEPAAQAPAAASAPEQPQAQAGGLRLATEISAPPLEKPAQMQGDKAAGTAPAASAASAKDRP